MKNDVLNKALDDALGLAFRVWNEADTNREKAQGREAWFAIVGMMRAMDWEDDYNEFFRRVVAGCEV